MEKWIYSQFSQTKLGKEPFSACLHPPYGRVIYRKARTKAENMQAYM
jgi:hypothetical protein